MAAPAKVAAPSLAKFRGAMVGAVVGDCLGAYFEGSWNVSADKVVKHFSNVEAKGNSGPVHAFTDDTAMARSVAASLIEHKDVDLKDMAGRFVEEFYKEPARGYGGNVVTVFNKLKEEKCARVHGPAGEQFGGSGSFGNGGAMRIVPAALFGYKYSEEELNQLVDGITRITHTHMDAVVGTQLQCAAVQLALRKQQEPETPLDCSTFLSELQQWNDNLRTAQKESETMSETSHTADGAPKKKKKVAGKSESAYSQKLKTIQEYLEQDTDVDRQDIEKALGNDISALGSVPAAIYSFLRCTRPVSDIPRDVPFERTILYAISLGGDTDTIATMAGAIAGAYYGIESIPELWQEICEGVQDAIDYADSFHKLVFE